MRKNLLALVFILNITNLFSQATDRIYLNNGKYEDITNVKYIKNFVSFSRLDSTSGFYDMKDVSRVKKIVTEINQFEFKDKLFTDFVVVKIDSLNKEKLFKRTLNWIKETYKNPNEVIKMTIENEKIRINGYKENLYCYDTFLGGSCYYGTYSIEISFKDGRYRFDPTYLEYRIPADKYNPAGLNVPVELTQFDYMYNNDGELRKLYKFMPAILEDTFNDLNLNLYKYILSQGKEKNDW